MRRGLYRLNSTVLSIHTKQENSIKINYPMPSSYCTQYQLAELIVHSESEKLGHYTFVHNFDKCWQIFKFSP